MDWDQDGVPFLHAGSALLTGIVPQANVQHRAGKLNAKELLYNQFQL